MQTFKPILGLLLLLGYINLSAQSSHPEYKVMIHTNMGSMKIKLYNSTPYHRDAFLKLVDEKHFDGTLFYRVVKSFVIQGGSSDSRNAPAGKHIGYGSENHLISAEFKPELFHKKGALCAPRQPENVAEFKISDISQFYIVQGRAYTSVELDMIEKSRNTPIMIDLKTRYYLPFKDELQGLKSTDPETFNIRIKEIKEKIDFEYTLSNKLEFTPEQRIVYNTIGGCPDLDFDYTVFGEVIEGLTVIDKIAALGVDKNNRPYTDVKITVQIVIN